MSAFHEVIDVDRSPGDVWAYLSDPAHLPEWQKSAVSVEEMDDGPFGLGCRIRVTRLVRGRDVPITMQVTEFEPPHTWSLRGVDGPVRGRVHGEITPLPDGRTRVTMDLDFEAHGIGRVLLPLVVRPQVRKELPENERLLKERLEQATT
ncbi:SRPBCC family protein [Streptomyces sp. NPDC048191]|uniref:SRPBCC family protein n=1 Tax=Streptomyces sp. NPDC048191 TaxID=3155484 RepID=UPI0033FA4031